MSCPYKDKSNIPRTLKELGKFYIDLDKKYDLIEIEIEGESKISDSVIMYIKIRRNE